MKEEFKQSGFNEAFAKSMSIQLPHPDQRDWPAFILRSCYVCFPTLVARITASRAANLSIGWTILFAVTAVGPAFLGALIGFATDARKPGARTRKEDDSSR